jgi:hypothetical protein
VRDVLLIMNARVRRLTCPTSDRRSMEGKGELRLDHRRTMRSVDMQVAANDPSPMSILDTD